MIGNHPKRRKGDKLPPEWAREMRLQELCNRQDEELQQLRAENARLRALAATKPIQHEEWCDATGAWGWKTSCDCGVSTQPMGLAA